MNENGWQKNIFSKTKQEPDCGHARIVTSFVKWKRTEKKTNSGLLNSGFIAHTIYFENTEPWRFVYQLFLKNVIKTVKLIQVAFEVV